MIPAANDDLCLTWVDHPARNHPRRLAAALGYLLAATAALQLGFATPWLTLLGALLLVAATADFLFPSTYRLDADGAACQGPLGRRRLPWRQVRSASLVDTERTRGVLLAPVAEPGLAQRWRAMWLPAAEVGEPTPATLTAWVERYATQRRSLAGTTEVMGA